MAGSSKNTPRANVMHWTKVLNCIIRLGPVTFADIREATGLYDRTIRNYVVALKRARLVYIADWDLDIKGRARVAMFSFGLDKPDARPVQMESAARKSEQARRRRRVRRHQETAQALADQTVAEMQEDVHLIAYAEAA